ncbi:acyltransferase family protein [Agarivorans sp. MS3-6]
MRVESLTFFRFIAALIVVIFHFGDATGFEGALIAGPEMVTFFFVLSGFVMSISHFERDIKTRSYLWARVSRIVPIYMVGILLVIGLDFYHNTPIWWSALLLNVTFLQSWVSPYPLSINYPGWSLSVEAFFYLSFPFILLYIKKNKCSVKSLAIYSAVYWLITQTILTYALSKETNSAYSSLLNDLIYYFPASHLCSFLIGISGGIWLLHNRSNKSNDTIGSTRLPIASAVTIVLVLDNKEHLVDVIGFAVPFSSSFLAPLFLIFIISLSLCQSTLASFFSRKPLVLLGEASFSLYILQVPVHKLYTMLSSKFFITSPLINFLTYLISLVFISILTFLYFEKPSNKFLRYQLPKLLNMGARDRKK